MTIYEISLVAVGLNTLINYCIGKPGSDFSPYEIFSDYTVWLSACRLKRIGLLDDYSKQYHETLTTKTKEHEIREFKNDFARVIYNAAEPFFTWERAFGMCSICTGFWVSLLTGLLFTFNILELVEIIVISHLAIRIVNKIL